MGRAPNPRAPRAAYAIQGREEPVAEAVVASASEEVFANRLMPASAPLRGSIVVSFRGLPSCWHMPQLLAYRQFAFFHGDCTATSLVLAVAGVPLQSIIVDSSNLVLRWHMPQLLAHRQFAFLQGDCTATSLVLAVASAPFCSMIVNFSDLVTLAYATVASLSAFLYSFLPKHLHLD